MTTDRSSIDQSSSASVLALLILLLQIIPLLLLPLAIDSSSYADLDVVAVVAADSELNHEATNNWCGWSSSSATIRTDQRGLTLVLLLPLQSASIADAVAATADWSTVVVVAAIAVIDLEFRASKLWRIDQTIDRSADPDGRCRWSVLCCQSQQGEKNRSSTPLKNRVGHMVLVGLSIVDRCP